MKNDSKTLKKKKFFKITAIVLAVIISFILATLIITPLVIVKPSHNEEAYKELTLIELEELMAESRPLNVPLVEDISISTSSGKLSGWVLHNSANTYSGNYNIMVYFGGRDEDASSSALRFFQQMADGGYFKNIDIAVIDWPGYGLSEGRATETSMKDSACAICNFFKNQKNVSNVYVCGYSLGCGPAIYAASKSDIAGLVLVSPYNSAYDLYNRYTPCFYGPMRLLITFKMEAHKFAQNVCVKPLIIYSQSDNVIPNDSAEQLATNFPKGYERIVLSSAGHGDLMNNTDVLSAIDIFLNNR